MQVFRVISNVLIRPLGEGNEWEYVELLISHRLSFLGLFRRNLDGLVHRPNDI